MSYVGQGIVATSITCVQTNCVTIKCTTALPSCRKEPVTGRAAGGAECEEEAFGDCCADTAAPAGKDGELLAGGDSEVLVPANG